MEDFMTETHVYIKPECELCDQTIHTDEWTVALLGHDDGLSPSHLTNKFRFPESQDVVEMADKLTLCQCLQCKMCELACPSVTIHANCYRVFQQSYCREDAMEAIWVASAWKSPWRHRPARRKPRLDLTDMTLVSIGGPVAEAIGIPGLALLPSEVLQMVRFYIPNNLLWRYSLIQNISEEMSRPFQNPFEPQHDATRFALAAVKAWKRELKVADTTRDESESEPFIVRLTVDCLGLKEIQRLKDWPEYNHIRSNTCAYVFFTQGQANGSFISFKVSPLVTSWELLLILNKFGRTFIENPHDSRDFQFWDTPSPPLRCLKMFPRPDRPGSIRYRTVDVLNTTGLTFFFLRGFIAAVHSHTANTPVAATAIQHFSQDEQDHMIWTYIPVSSTDALLRIGVGDVWQRQMEICTKLTGTYFFGPYEGYTDTDDVSGNEPSVLIHNVPTKLAGGSLGIVTKHNFESEHLLSFPRYHNDGEDPLNRDRIHTAAPAKNITHADVYYDRRNGHCKGLLLKYANGAQRAVGQCRIGIDPFKAYEEPSWFCYRDICDPETLEDTGSCVVECTTGTNNHEHEPCDLDDWQCMRARAGSYLEFLCDSNTDTFYMYVRHDEEENDD
ncbi:uncharacterized protein FSUBG_4163 [Fusarium subglutinans]|uniref:Uncharacterized protein n=1 Tax=Gibberella subglutinans TaxID=42677 RepID=A0A8H5V4P3_GIBSU|nr:uncharacterized protein FSUBG_4163 [Fusarium subglutinans]KAF5609153.1 hypothetical protein FSUBG_4163 [Fusarium subglutinans]